MARYVPCITFWSHPETMMDIDYSKQVCIGFWRKTAASNAYRTCDQRFASIVMASTERIADVTRAAEKGWRTFYVSADGQPLPELATLPESFGAGPQNRYLPGE